MCSSSRWKNTFQKKKEITDVYSAHCSVINNNYQRD